MSRRIALLLLALLLISVVPTLAQDGPTVGLGESDTLGSYLVGPNGMTLYSFTPDPLNTSVCYNRCAEAWPPLIVESADGLTAAEGIPGTLGTTERDDGTLQVTYNGIPLYYWFQDTEVGDTTGNRVGRNWWIVPPATVYGQVLPTVGTVLVGPTGMTLYLYTKDTADVSNCYDKCATNWPPLLVDSADALVSGVNLPGVWNTITRTDTDKLQVTYNGWPLYYWKDDVAIGDSTGEGVGQVWYVIAPETVTISSTDALGDFLVSNNGGTLYTFSNDTAGVSNCTGECLENWPAFTIGAEDKLAPGANVGGELGTIVLENGSQHVTYNGMPLYYFKDDLEVGETNGEGAGGKWTVAKP